MFDIITRVFNMEKKLVFDLQSTTLLVICYNLSAITPGHMRVTGVPKQYFQEVCIF